MINLVRKIVAGPKNRTVDQEHDLDLTYITDKIIAMAFPATGFEKTYRNSIDDVVSFLQSRHQLHYLIINASNRKYNYDKFHNQVLQFFWTDHQAPPLTTLFEVCEKIESFLEENNKNVVSVHCNHGKGRTGTAIISYLLYSSQFTDVKKALKFYNERRFTGSTYGVDQPCQLRYLNYFKSFLQLPYEYTQKPMKAFKLTRVHQKGMKDKQLFIRISQTRTQHVIYPMVFLSEPQIKFVRPLMGDIYIQLLADNWTGQKQLLRINFHLFFLSKNNENHTYQVLFVGDEIKMKHNLQQFELTLQFQEFCHCHEQKSHKQNCMCTAKRERQQEYWDNMVKIIQKNQKRHPLTQKSSQAQDHLLQQNKVDIQSDQIQQLEHL